MGRKVKRPAVKSKPEEGRTDERTLRHFALGEGLPDIMAIRSELQDMTDVLLGRREPPVDLGVMTLHEVADAYFARASELTMLIHQGETDGRVSRGSHLYKLRTGELRDFLDMAKRAADLGSRRVTAAQMELHHRQYAVPLGH